MAKSVQNYIDELYSQGKTEADRLKEQRTQADDKLIQQTNAAIDKAAAASAKPYQTQLDELPALYGKLYDANAVQELVNRRQVQETMANMGLTDSGLSRRRSRFSAATPMRRCGCPSSRRRRSCRIGSTSCSETAPHRRFSRRRISATPPKSGTAARWKTCAAAPHSRARARITPRCRRRRPRPKPESRRRHRQRHRRIWLWHKPGCGSRVLLIRLTEPLIIPFGLMVTG